jgi:hypothetical protein
VRAKYGSITLTGVTRVDMVDDPAECRSEIVRWPAAI